MCPPRLTLHTPISVAHKTSARPLPGSAPCSPLSPLPAPDTAQRSPHKFSTVPFGRFDPPACVPTSARCHTPPHVLLDCSAPSTRPAPLTPGCPPHSPLVPSQTCPSCVPAPRFCVPLSPQHMPPSRPFLPAPPLLFGCNPYCVCADACPCAPHLTCFYSLASHPTCRRCAPLGSAA